MPRRTPSLRSLVAALLVAIAVFATPAAAEMPSNRDAPSITAGGGPVVGQVLVGNNGTWLYADGSACRAECEYRFTWQRCAPGGDCASIPGAGARAYRVAEADAGRSLRVAVSATKYDCNAHGQDCRHVTRTAVSAQTAPVSAAAPPQVRLRIASVAVERTARGLAVTVRVTDAEGRAVRAARVTVGDRSRATGGTGLARVALRRASRAGAVALAIRVEKAGADPAALAVRVPLGR